MYLVRNTNMEKCLVKKNAVSDFAWLLVQDRLVSETDFLLGYSSVEFRNDKPRLD